jgi:hypothetical protein
MSDTQKAIFEPNGLLDFFPTPPQSLEEDIEPPTQPAPRPIEQRPSQYKYDDDEPPPPDFDEEPSDFEDEVHGIMEREESSSSRPFGGMDIDDEEDMPIASCECSIIDTSDNSLTSEVTCIPYSTT